MSVGKPAAAVEAIAPAESAPLVTRAEGAEVALCTVATAIWRRAGGNGAPRIMRSSAALAAPGAQADIVLMDIATANEQSLGQALATARNAVAPGGVIAGQLHRAGLTRDRIAVRLYEAGYAAPTIWADKAALADEAQVLRPLAHLLSRQALGDGPDGFAARLPSGGNAFAFVAPVSPLAPPAERRTRLSVVFPVFNEASTFREVMDALLAKTVDGVDIEIVLVESKSTDGTHEIALSYKDHPRVKLVLQERPRGKGFGVREGFAHATGDIILIQDADFEYSLDDYETVLAPVLEGRASFVLGSRHTAERGALKMREFKDQKAAGNLLNVGHVFFTSLLDIIYFQRLKDPFTMYKVFRRDCIHNMHFESNRFDFDHELVGKLVRGGHTPVEVPVRYEARSFTEGKKVRVFGDPPTWIRALLKYRFARLHVWNGE